MKSIIILCTILGVATGLYFLLCFTYAGLSTSFTLVWLGSSVAFFIVRFFLIQLRKNEIMLPKEIQSIVGVVILLGIGLFVYAESLIIYSSKQSAPSDVDYVIVLGARVNGTTITGSLKKRLDTAVLYLKENQQVPVIVTGGKGTGEDISEAEAMERYLVQAGIDASRIIREDRATTTFENIKYSRELIENDAAKVAIVTNGFHIYRATSMAKAQGMTNVYGISAPSDSILCISYYTREAVAVLKYKLTGDM